MDQLAHSVPELVQPGNTRVTTTSLAEPYLSVT